MHHIQFFNSLMSHTLFAYEVSGTAIFNVFILSSIPQHGLCYVCLKKVHSSEHKDEKYRQISLKLNNNYEENIYPVSIFSPFSMQTKTCLKNSQGLYTKVSFSFFFLIKKNCGKFRIKAQRP